MAESVCELEPLHSSQKSFGWKAIVVEERDASQLFSYGVLVATATKKLGGGSRPDRRGGLQPHDAQAR